MQSHSNFKYMKFKDETQKEIFLKRHKTFAKHYRWDNNANSNIDLKFYVLRYCEKCDGVKPLRCHHCSKCDACYLKMDHHCFWVGNCIGIYNHKHYTQLLVYTTIMGTTEAGIVLYEIISLLLDGNFSLIIPK